MTASRVVRALAAASLFAVALTLAFTPVRKSAEDVSLSCGTPVYTSFRSTAGWEQRESRREIQKLLDEHSPPGSIHPSPGHLDVPPVQWVIASCVSASRTRAAISLVAAVIALGIAFGPALLAMRRRSSSTPTQSDHQLSAPAGWHTDPADASWQRYWDGSGWTDQRRPATGRASAPGPRSSPGRKPRGWAVITLVFIALAATVALLPINQTLYGGTDHPYRISCGNAGRATLIGESTVLEQFFQYAFDKIMSGPYGPFAEDDPNSVASHYADTPRDYRQQVKHATDSCHSAGRVRLLAAVGIIGVGALCAWAVPSFQRRRART